jgi:hypothetical protein
VNSLGRSRCAHRAIQDHAPLLENVGADRAVSVAPLNATSGSLGPHYKIDITVEHLKQRH